jgi:hypothetical protein
MSQQCFILTTPSQVVLPNTSTKFYVVKEKIQDHTISVEHVRTTEMLADPLTKGLPPNVFREHLAGVGLRTQYVQRTLSRRGFTGKSMIPEQ